MSRKNQDIRDHFYGKQSSDRRDEGDSPLPGTSGGAAIGISAGRTKPQAKKQRFGGLSTEEIADLIDESQGLELLDEESLREVTLECGDNLRLVDNLEPSLDPSFLSRLQEEQEEADAAEGIDHDQEDAGPSFTKDDAAHGLKILE